MQKIQAAQLRIEEAEKASEKKLKAARREKNKNLREKGALLKAISECDTASAKKEKKLREKDAEIEAATKELHDIHEEIDKMVTELNALDDTVTSTEITLLLRHVVYRLTPKG